MKLAAGYFLGWIGLMGWLAVSLTIRKWAIEQSIFVYMMTLVGWVSGSIMLVAYASERKSERRHHEPKCGNKPAVERFGRLK